MGDPGSAATVDLPLRLRCEDAKCLLVGGIVVIAIAALALHALLVAVIGGLTVEVVAVLVIVLLALRLAFVVLVAFTVAHLVEAVIRVVRMRLCVAAVGAHVSWLRRGIPH